MLGLALIGLMEAVVVLWQARSLSDLGVLPFALVAYGVCGVLGGLGLGFVVGLVTRPRRRAFALYLALFFLLGASVIGRFRVIRDVFAERMPQGVIPMLAQLGALLLLALIAFGVFRLGCHLSDHRVGRRLTRPLGGLAGLAVVAGLAAVVAAIPRLLPESQLRQSRTPPPAAPPIILIMVDTLRADYLSCYGYTGRRTPHIDRLASDGIRFERAFAQASWTRPSVATILTSLYPSSHGAVHKGDILPDSVETVAEVLQAQGYRTLALANNANVSEIFNFQQGFDTFEYLAPDMFFYASESAAELLIYRQLRLVRERFLSRRKWVRYYYQPAEVVTDRALRLVERERGHPFLLLLHYMDPHDPYFVHPFNGEGIARVATPRPEPARAEELEGLYDGEVGYLDEHLGRLFEGLRAQGVYERALIVLTADHGEEFFEHGGWWHGTTLYEEQINVPLIVKAPGASAAGRVATGLAGIIDIAPTLLAAAGAPIPGEMQGRVLNLSSPDDGAPEFVFSEEELEGNQLRAVRAAQWKLIVANEDNPRGQPAAQLFHVAADPGELDNLFAKEPAQEATLTRELNRLVAEAAAHGRVTEQRAIDSATEERLKALGYVD
jgi:arylsulfatase